MSKIQNITNTTLPGGNAGFNMSFQAFALFTAVYTAICLFAIISNSLVVVAFLRYKALRFKTVNHMITSLSASDGLVGLTSIPLWIYILHGIVFHHRIDRTVMEIWQILDMFSGIVSIIHLVVISCDVYYAVAFPMRRRQLIRSRLYSVILCFVWLIPAIMACCSQIPRFRGYIYFITIAFFLFPLLIIFLTNFRIAFLLNRRKKHLQELGSLKRDLKDSRTLILIIICFIFSWGPFYISGVLTLLRVIPYSLTLVAFVKVLHYGNSAINPIIYAIRIPQFQTALRKMLGCRLCRARVHIGTAHRAQTTRTLHTFLQSDLFTTSSSSERHQNSNTGTSSSLRNYLSSSSNGGTALDKIPRTPSPEQRFSFFI